MADLSCPENPFKINPNSQLSCAGEAKDLPFDSCTSSKRPANSRPYSVPLSHSMIEGELSLQPAKRPCLFLIARSSTTDKKGAPNLPFADPDAMCHELVVCSSLRL